MIPALIPLCLHYEVSSLPETYDASKCGTRNKECISKKLHVVVIDAQSNSESCGISELINNTLSRRFQGLMSN
jgi:hypothetical protein